MSVAAEPVHYPESDGKPMAETDVHRDEMFYFIEGLRHRYRDQEVYVSGNLLLYYVEGDPTRCVSPDCLVAFGRPAGQRRIYKTWVEGKVPDVVIEVTSSSTRREDQHTKRQLYARLGVRELWLVDPLGDCLKAPFRGYRLHEGSWIELTVSDGRARSPLLGLDFCATPEAVRLFDPVTGTMLPTPGEVASRLEETSRKLDNTTRELDHTARELDNTTRELRQESDENARLRAEIERLQAALAQQQG